MKILRSLYKTTVEIFTCTYICYIHSCNGDNDFLYILVNSFIYMILKFTVSNLKRRLVAFYSTGKKLSKVI